MSDAVNCEYCVNYSYDDDYECYTCEVNLDEDEMVKFITGNHWCHTGFNRCFHFYIFYRKISQSFVSHKNSDFFYQFTEFIRSCVFVSQHRDFVLDQRVVHDTNVLHYPFPLFIVFLLFYVLHREACCCAQNEQQHLYCSLCSM